MESKSLPWPELNYERLRDTIATVHLWTQIIGKIRLRQMPWLNHSWHVTLYVSPRGLTTGSMPYARGFFQIDLDFVGHQLIIISSEGLAERTGLYPRSVADFYKEIFAMLARMEIDVTIHGKPNEVVPAIPFEEDEVHKSYDAHEIMLFWQALVRINLVFVRFRSGFIGKVSPVHFFWGSFDLAVTRFSGRKAPKYPGSVPNIPDDVMQEAYSHEVSSCGFWPGADEFPTPAFYSYCYPTPADFGGQPVEPAEAFWSKEKGEFFLPYEAVRQADDPEETLLRFLRSTYKAAAVTGQWDKQLECDLTFFEKGNRDC
jgi:Family of unknown function (DUF5996)